MKLKWSNDSRKEHDTTDHPMKCNHDYKCVYEGWEDETYQCSKCGHRYKLYYEDMK